MTDSMNSFLSKAYALQNPGEARNLYDEWAASYDKDLDSLDYAFPTHAATALISALDDRDVSTLKVLDAGCGTGLVGICLAKDGVKHVEGIDISPKMLEMARKSGTYAVVEEADLTKPIARKEGEFDAVTCAGTLTEGHVGPAAIDEFVRIVKKDGIISATVKESVWESGGYKAKVDELADAGKVKLIRAEPIGLKKSENSGGMIMVLKKM